jgi:class 3 adenylate cyclase
LTKVWDSFCGVQSVLVDGEDIKVGNTNITNPMAAASGKGDLSLFERHQPMAAMKDSVFIQSASQEGSSSSSQQDGSSLPMNTSTIINRSVQLVVADDDDGIRSNHSYSSTTTRKNVTRRGIVVLTEIHNLVPKNVAILILNARGTHALALSGGAGELEAEQVKLVELIQKCTRSGNGVVDAFQGDHFVITFNAVRAVGTPVISAARVALKIEERAQHEGLALGCFSMGLGGGRALVGNVGSATMKKSCTVGSVYTIAAGLEVLAKRVGRTCVTHGRCLSGLQHTTSIMLLGSAQLTATRQEVTGCIMSRPATESTSPDSHAWLYRSDAANTDDEFSNFNTLMEIFIIDGVDAVERAIEDMASRGVDDSNVEGGGVIRRDIIQNLLCKKTPTNAIIDDGGGDVVTLFASVDGGAYRGDLRTILVRNPSTNRDLNTSCLCCKFKCAVFVEVHQRCHCMDVRKLTDSKSTTIEGS